MSTTLGVPGSKSGSSLQPQTPSPSQSFEMDDSAVMSERASINNVETSSRAEGSLAIKGVARHTVGLILLLFVVLLWTTSNFLGSSIFADGTYAKPFFVTYANTGTFILALLPTLIKSTYTKYKNGTLRSTTRAFFSIRTLREFCGLSNSNLEASYHSEREAFLKPNTIIADGQPTTAAVNASEAIAAVDFAEEYLALIPTARMALAFCFLWFGANYFTVACLQYTTVASTTILTATSSVWTLLIGTLTRTEKFTWRKLCGVLASIVGIILISRVDLTSADDEDINNPGERGLSAPRVLGLKTLFATAQYLGTRALSEFPDKTVGQVALGDAMALLSAIIYGFYTIVLKHTTLKAYPLDLHMPTFFGLVGLFNLILLLPMFPILHYTGVETFEWPSTSQVWWIIAANSLSSMVSDITWAYAMVFTSPLVVTVGLSLNIPLSLVGEMIIQSRYEGWIYWVGAMVVVGSFVFVEREEVKEEKEIVEEYMERSFMGSFMSRHSEGGTGRESRESRRGKQRASDDLEGLIFDESVDVERVVAGPSIRVSADREPGSRAGG